MSEKTTHDVNEADFEERVIARSREVPVVVDFWASWCAPCRTLAPVLESEVRALGGRVELVKVDTDQNQQLSQSFRVRGIPAVMAFRGGKVVDEFVGAQSATFVREFLGRLAPSAEQQVFEEALSARARGDNPAAEGLCRDLLARLARGVLLDEAALLLARILLETGRAGEVEEVLARIDPRGPATDQADVLRALVSLDAEARAYPGGEAAAREALATNEADLDARYALACVLATSGKTVEALEPLIEIVTRSRKFKDDGALRAMRAIFAYLGGDNDVVRDYRRRLQVVT